MRKPPVRVLVAEDELFIRLLLVEALEEAGYDILATKTASRPSSLSSIRMVLSLWLATSTCPALVALKSSGIFGTSTPTLQLS